MVNSNDRNLSDHPFFQVVEQRVSVRKYRPDPVPQEHLELILNAARLAPNSGNQQACRYLVVKDRERLDELRESCISNRKTVLRARGDEVPEEEAIRGYYDVVFSAPLYVLVLVDNKLHAVQFVYIVTELVEYQSIDTDVIVWCVT